MLPTEREGCFLGLENIHLLPNPVKLLSAKRSLHATEIDSAILNHFRFIL